MNQISEGDSDVKGNNGQSQEEKMLLSPGRKVWSMLQYKLKEEIMDIVNMPLIHTFNAM